MRKFTTWVLAVIGALILGFGIPGAYAQSTMETQLRQEFERKLNDLRAEFEKKLTEAVAREVAKAKQENISQEVKTSVKQALEAQAPAALLAPAPMPPSGAGVGLFGNIEFGGTNFWGLDTPFAALSSPDTTVAAGAWQNVDVDRGFSVRPTLGFYLPNGRGILSANYFHADASGTASYSPGGRITGPGDLGLFDENLIFSGRAKNNAEINQVDAQYQYPIQVTGGFVFTPEFGLRYVSFNNHVKMDYFDSGGDPAFTRTFKSKSQAGGPKIGLGAAWTIINDVTLVVDGAGGYLLGTNRAFRRCVGVVDGCRNPARLRSNNNDSRGFPFIEGDFSINYNTPVRGLSSSVGWRIASFFEMTTRMRDGDGFALFEPRQDVFEQRNLTYDSIYFRMQYLW